MPLSTIFQLHRGCLQISNITVTEGMKIFYFKTYALHHQSQVTIADFAYPVSLSP
jgi:hypothetical protein